LGFGLSKRIFPRELFQREFFKESLSRRAFPGGGPLRPTPRAMSLAKKIAEIRKRLPDHLWDLEGLDGPPAAVQNLAKGYDLLQAEPPGYQGAAACFKKAAKLGSAAALRNLAWLAAGGFGEKADKIKAYQLMAKSAKAGSAEAARDLAMFLARGLGVPQDLFKAAVWMAKAAEAGDPKAMLELGMMRSLGRGVPQDKAMAAKWFRRAAQAGEAAGELALGLSLSIGEGAPKNSAEGARLLAAAASKGEPLAMAGAGLALAFGQDLPEDRDLAAYFLQRAAEAMAAAAKSALDSEGPLGGPEAAASRARSASSVSEALPGGSKAVFNC
jgi:TPR repeat protein